MSIKKPAIFKSANSASVKIESPNLITRKMQERETFIPAIDFSSASNFVRFGSAKEYYAESIKRIYTNYPYDGSAKEKLVFELSSSYLDRYVLNQLYPKSKGSARFGYDSHVVINRGYQEATTDFEKSLSNLFANKNVPHDTSNRRKQTFFFNFDDGFTFEWWMQKGGWTNASETLFEASSSQGFLKIMLSGSDDGTGPVRLYASSSTEIPLTSLASSTITTASVGDNTFHHYALTLFRSASAIVSNFYIDGVSNNRITNHTNITNITDMITGFLGSGSYGLLSASVDDFRFWNKKQSSERIYYYYKTGVDGGASTDDYRKELGVYYKFNEGITNTASVDRIVLDYSGRIANGYWNNYVAANRSTESGVPNEVGDFIVRSSHSEVVGLNSRLATSGSLYDSSNSMSLYDLVPAWLREDDENNNLELKKLVQIIGSYFDTLFSQVESIVDLKSKKYYQTIDKPLPFSRQLLENQGVVAPEILINKTVLNFFSERDENGVIYERDLEELKNLIYNNIYANIDFILKSKGTYKAYRNLIRCFGVDDELVKLNLYVDNATQYLVDKNTHTSEKTKHINFNNPDRFGASVYQQNTISGSRGAQLEKNLALTAEVEVMVPKKPEQSDSFFFNTPFYTSSVFGLDAVDPNGTQYSSSAFYDNFQVYLVTSPLDPNRAKWMLKQIRHSDSTTVSLLTTDMYSDIYDNQRWNIAVKVYPLGYPFAGSFSTSDDPDYTLEFYGVSHNMDEVLHEFKLTSSISAANARSLLSSKKKLYVGARRSNWTGTVLQKSDVKIAAASLYFDKLDDASIKAHNKDPSNYGHNKVFGNPTVFGTDITDRHIPAQHSLALHWDFQAVTSSDSAGTFTVEDYSSGSSVGRYNWLENIINAKHQGAGVGFPVSSTKVVSNEFIFASKKNLPEISFDSDTTKIMTDQDIYLFEDEDINDNIFVFEKSMYQSISQKMLDMFTSIHEYSNLFAKPIDRYKKDYKKLAHIRRLFFERVSGSMDLDRFTNYFKWIDASIYKFIEQLHPGNAKFLAGINDTVESHILERPKYQHLLPTLTKRDELPDGIVKGTNELTYNWRVGHSPVLPKATGTVSLNNTSIANFYNTVIRLTDAGGTLRRYILQNTATSNTGTTVSLNPGSGAVNHVVVGIQGLTYITAVNQIIAAIESANGHAGSIKGENRGSGVLSLKQSAGGTAGNVAIIAQSTYVDGSSTWAAYGIGTVAGFSGGEDKNNTNCLWQKERKELGSDRHKLRSAIITHTTGTVPSFGDNNRNIYGGSSHAIKRFSKPYNFEGTEQHTIHGGINYARIKDRDFIKPLIYIHGPKSNVGVPLNVVVLGVGEGKGIVNVNSCQDDKDHPLNKPKYGTTAVVGRFSDLDGSTPISSSNLATVTTSNFVYNIKGDKVFPFNLISGSESTGYNKTVFDNYEDNAIITNLHSDTTDPTNEIPMQGPFTQQWVGGRQSRHVGLNRHNATFSSPNKLDAPSSRAEEWRLLFGEHPDESIKDGALGFTGPDYGGPYPDDSRPIAIHYRDGRAKRPLNVANIQYTTASKNIGNYQNSYEVVHSVGKTENNRVLKSLGHSATYLPADIKNALPHTTNTLNLLGVIPDQNRGGNIFGTSSNRSRSQQEFVSLAPAGGIRSGSFASGSFLVTGSSYFRTRYTGSFTIQPPPKAATNATFKFNVTGSSVHALPYSASFTLGTIPREAKSAYFEYNLSGHPSTWNANTVALENFTVTASSDTGSEIFRVFLDKDGNNPNAGDRDLVVPGFRRALEASHVNIALATADPFTGLNNNDFTVSFWFNNKQADTNTTNVIQFVDSGSLIHKILPDDDIQIQIRSSSTYKNVDFNANTATAKSGSWHHYVIRMPITAGSSSVPYMYVDGVFLTASQGAQSLGGSSRHIDEMRLQIDDNCAFQDLILYNRLLTSEEAVQVYNSGQFFDPSTAAFANTVVSWFKLGEEQEWYNLGYQLSGALNSVGGNDTRFFSSSYGTDANKLLVDHTYDEDFRFRKGVGYRDLDDVCRFITSSFNTKFPNWRSYYVSGSRHAANNGSFHLNFQSKGERKYSFTTADNSLNAGALSAQTTTGYNATTGSTLANSSSIRIDNVQHTLYHNSASVGLATDLTTYTRRPAIYFEKSTQYYLSSSDYRGPDYKNNAITVTAWSRRLDSSDVKVIFTFEDSAADNLVQLRYDNDDFNLFTESDNSGSTDLQGFADINNVFSSPAVAVGDFYHLALVLYSNNTTTPEFYINGEGPKTITSWDADGGGLSAINRLFIGTNSLPDAELSASLSDFCVWNTALTQDAIREAYNSGSWCDLRSHVSASSIWDWWTLDGTNSGSYVAPGANRFKPEIGRNTLDVGGKSTGNGLLVQDGTYELKTDAVFRDHIKSTILSTVGYSGSHVEETNLTTFNINKFSSTVPANLSETGNSFNITTQISQSGDNLILLKGANGSHYVNFSFNGTSTRVYADPTNVYAGGTFGTNGGHYYAYSSGSDTFFWNNLLNAFNTAYSGVASASYFAMQGSASFFLRSVSSGVKSMGTPVAGGTTFPYNKITASNGQVAVASTLKGGDRLTVNGVNFDIAHTTSGSQGVVTSKEINTGTSYRKALFWQPTAANIVHASNANYTNPDASSVSISFWARPHSVDSSTKGVFYFKSSGGDSLRMSFDEDDIEVRLLDGSAVNTYTYTACLTANVYKHFTLVVNKTISNNPVLYIDGEVKAGSKSGTATGTLRALEQIYIGDYSAIAGTDEYQGSLQDFAVWNTALTNDDARVLYNSGSWLDLQNHVSASHIWDWWLLGNESHIGQASGSALSSGTAVTAIDSRFGYKHPLTLASNSNVFVTDGITRNLKSNSVFWGDVIQTINLSSSFTEFNANLTGSTANVTITGKSDAMASTGDLTNSISETGTTFAIQNTGTSNGADIAAGSLRGAGDNKSITIGSISFRTDHNASTSGANFTKVSSIYHINSSGSTNAVFWNRLHDAIETEFPNYATTYTALSNGIALFEITASVTGAAEIRNISSADGTTFLATSFHGVTGGAAALSVGGPLNVVSRVIGDKRQKSIISSRFSAPGGPEVQSYGYLDAHAQEYSVYNSINYRNYSVRGKADSGSSGQSGEFGTIRVNSHAQRREGLNLLHSRHCGQFGLDSSHGLASQSDFGGGYEASFHKIHRNAQVKPAELFSKALRNPAQSTSDNHALHSTGVSGYSATGGFSATFWLKFDANATDATTKVIAIGRESTNVAFEIYHSSGKIYYKLRDSSGNENSFQWNVALTELQEWSHIGLTWDGNFANDPVLYINGSSGGSGGSPDASSKAASGTNRRTANQLYLYDSYFTTPSYELQGAMQEFAFWSKTLSSGEVASAYNSGGFINLTSHSAAANLIDYWRLGEEEEFEHVNFDTTGGLIIISSAGGTGGNSLDTGTSLVVVKGFFKKTPTYESRKDNFYVQSAIPQSDYNYSWVTSSLGSNYDIRSGRQKVFGYWPKNGILSSSAGFDSAIVFPTSADIQGSS